MNNQQTLFPIDTDPLSSSSPGKWAPRPPVSKPEPTTAPCWDCNGVDPTCKSCHGTQRVPIAHVNQVKALIAAQIELHPSVRGHVAAILYAAGPARKVNGVTVGGKTIQELAVEVTARRGITTKETSITQALKDLRGGERKDKAGNVVEILPEFVRDSGLERMGNAGKNVTVYEHTYIITNTTEKP